MKKYGIQGIICLVLLSLLFFCKRNERPWQLYSPDKQIRAEISKKELISSDRLFYTLYQEQNGTYVQITDPSPLGIEREDSKFIENLELVSAEEKLNEEERYSLVTGKKLECRSAYNELMLTFKNQDRKRVSIIFRAYNDGVAFRYLFTGKSQKNVRVIREYSGFDFKEGNIWAHPYDTLSMWTPAYETYFEGPLAVGTPAPWNKNGWALPILVESEGSWMLVSEAGFDGTYGASHLHGECEGGRYMLKFAEQGEAEGYYESTSHAPLPWYTPWRFIAVGTSLTSIVETTLPTDLSSPLSVENISWIRPGRASWSWWSVSDSPQDYDQLVPFVDFAAEMEWEYSLVDANWNRMRNGTMEQLAAYAETRNVGLLLWYNSGGKHNMVMEQPRDLMDDRKERRKEFEQISKLGIKGIKVDFFQSDKQEIIRQYIDILQDAADFNLLVNFHGCTLPRGWRRTWPNLVSMEAVRGEECYKFDRRFPEKAPGNMAILPFTRNAVGPVDYTPGGFSDHTFPHLTTYGFELALPVVLESGIYHHADTPETTLGLPPCAVDFLKKVPVVWDDTKLIAGYPGKDVVLARRSGNTWYIGGINGEGFAKDLTIDLSVTGAVPETMMLIEDGSSARDLQQEHVQTREGKITVHLLPYGGFTGYWE